MLQQVEPRTTPWPPAMPPPAPESTSADWTSIPETHVQATWSSAGDVRRGRDYMHARFYSPQMGRFFSVDPVGGSPEDPQSWNRYVYTTNNPLKYVDPSGMIFLLAGKAELYALLEGLQDAGAADFAESLTYKHTEAGILLDMIDAEKVPNNELAQLVAEIANDEQRTVSLGFTSEDLGGFGGAVTERSFLTDTVPIRMNLQQIRGTFVLGTFRTGPRKGQTGISGISQGAALFHELGHAAAFLRGLSGDPSLAIHYENTFRYLSDDPFFRLSHSPREAFRVPVR